MSLPIMIKQSIIGLIGCSVLVIPILLNLRENLGLAAPPDFDYAGFLRLYYPNHFFADIIPAYEYAIFGAVILLGAMSCLALGTRAKPFRIMAWGAVATYAVGVLLPLFTNSQFLLNLHLLRSGLIIYLLAALFSSVLATRWLAAAENQLFGNVLAICLCTVKSTIPLAIFVIVIARFWKPSTRWRLQPASNALWVIPLLGFLVYKGQSAWQANAEQSSAIREWSSVGAWARHNTPASAIFLLPTVSFRQEASPNGNSLYLGDSAIFLYTSERGIRGNFKDGAAVMWSTPYYRIWKSEIDAGLSNRTLSAMLENAKSRGINYIIYPCAAPEEQHSPLFRTDHICVFSSAT